MISSLRSKFDRAARRALYITEDRAAVYHWSGGNLSSVYRFERSDEGLAAFQQYLLDSPDHPLYILVDASEEEYRLDTVPHVFGGDRRAIIQRKQERMFRNTTYCHAEFHGREQEGRRDDRILFTCLANSERIKPWAQTLGACKIPLAGIYSVPFLTSFLLDDLADVGSHALLVSIQGSGVLRQTFFHNRQLRFSRLAKLPRYGSRAYPQEAVDEVGKILKFLRSQRLIDPDSPPRVYFLVEDSLRARLAPLCKDSANVGYRFVDIGQLYRNAGISRELVGPFADALFVHLLLKHRPRNLYASDYEVRYFEMHRTRNAMLAASLLLVIGGIGWSGFNVFEGITFKQQSLAAVEKEKFYNARYQVAKERLPAVPVEARDMKLAVEIADTLQDYKATPVGMLETLSRGLDQFADIQLEGIDWTASLNPETRPDQPKPQPGTVQSSPQSTPPAAPGQYQYYQIAVLKGYIDPFNGDYRQAIARINQFAEALRSQDSVYDVNILSLPLDISSEASLQGVANAVAGEAAFSIRVVLGVNHET